MTNASLAVTSSVPLDCSTSGLSTHATSITHANTFTASQRCSTAMGASSSGDALEYHRWPAQCCEASPDNSPHRRLRPSHRGHLGTYGRFSLVAYLQYAPRCASGRAPRYASRCSVSLDVVVVE